MTAGAKTATTESVLIYAPVGRDGEVIASVLKQAEIDPRITPDLASFLSGLPEATAAVVTEEALLKDDRAPLAAWVAEQPPWSDFPFILLSFRGESEARTGQLVDMLGNVTL